MYIHHNTKLEADTETSPLQYRGAVRGQRYGARAFHLASSYEVMHHNGPLAALQPVPPLPVLPGPVFV